MSRLSRPFGNHLSCFLAGLVASAGISFVLSVSDTFGTRFLGLHSAIGYLFLGRADELSWTLGFFMTLFGGGLVGLVYAQAFRRLRRGGGLTGLKLSLLHWLIAGFIVGLLPGIESDFAGFFASGGGQLGLFMFLGVHLLFGLMLGAVDAGFRRKRLMFEPAKDMSRPAG